MAHSAGESVSALIAEISIEKATTAANCWNSCPVMPGMKATGRNTDSSTRVMATMGPVIWPMAFLDASRGDSPSSSMIRSTFSTTTMASSTTMPMASTMASSEMVLSENPIRSRKAREPIRATGTAISGIRVARQLPRNRNTTRMTSTKASKSVWTTFSRLALTKSVVS